MNAATATKSKPDPPAAADRNLVASAEWLVAIETWQSHRRRMREMERKHEELTLCVQVANSPRPLQQRVLPLVAALDPAVLARVERAPRRAERELEELHDQIREAQPAYFQAHERYQAAKSTEVARLAGLFRERHADSIRKVAVALEMLNVEVENEKAVRREFARLSPEPTSHLLPDETGIFREMVSSTWGSDAAAWLRRLRQLGVLK